MKTASEYVKEMLESREMYIPAILDQIKEIDIKLCKSLICMLPNRKELLHQYQIPWWCRKYSDEVVMHKLVAIYELGMMRNTSRGKKATSTEYLEAEECFRKKDYDGARYWLYKASENGDERAAALIKSLRKMKKNSFRI